MERLRLTEDQLIGLLATGQLPHPGKLSKERVAWRLDEIEAIEPVLLLN